MNPSTRVLGTIVFGYMIVGGSWGLWKSLRTGTMTIADGRFLGFRFVIVRVQQPFLFWLYVGTIAFAIFVMTVILPILIFGTGKPENSN